MRWPRPKSFREALTTARSRLTARTGRSAGSMSTGQRTPPRPTAPPSTDGWPTDGWYLDGYLPGTTPTNAKAVGQLLDLENARFADTLPEPGSRDSAREWADCLLSIANVLQDESNSEPFRYATGRLVMASVELRRWADEES